MFFGQFSKISEVAQNIRDTFFNGSSYVLGNFDKKGLCYIMGDFSQSRLVTLRDNQLVRVSLIHMFSVIILTVKKVVA
jgi:hypothetical protein